MILTCIYSAILIWNEGPNTGTEYVKNIPVACKLISKSEKIGDNNEIQHYTMDCRDGLITYKDMLTKRTHQKDGTVINPARRVFGSEDCYNLEGSDG